MTDDVESPGESPNPSAEPVGREAPPTMPSRGAFLASFLSVVVAGVFGGVIGYGLVNVSSSGDSATAKVVGTIVGAVTAAFGVGVVAVLVLRAMAEWRRNPNPPPRRRLS